MLDLLSLYLFLSTSVRGWVLLKSIYIPVALLSVLNLVQNREVRADIVNDQGVIDRCTLIIVRH